MDMTDFRSFYTVVLLVIFVAIWIWAWSRSNARRFNNAANSLFDEKEEQIHAASMKAAQVETQQAENKNE